MKKAQAAGRITAALGSLLLALLTETTTAGSWTPRTISAQDLFDVSFPTTTRGWAIGKGGVMLASPDNGVTWAAQTSGTSSDLLGVDFVDVNRGWAVGAGDTVIRTTNGGVNWTFTSTGTGASLADVDFVDANNGWAVGATSFIVNTVAHTSDGGQTWTAQSAPTGIGLTAVSFSDAQRGFIVGFLNTAYRTDDGGTSWLPMVVSPNGFEDSFYAVRRINSSEGLIAGFKGDIYRTENGGATWTAVARFGKPIRGLAVAGTSAFAVGDGGLIARSEDGGVSWEAESSGITKDLKGVTAPGAASAFGVGLAGTLVEFRDLPVIPLPLDLSPLPQACENLQIVWRYEAAGVPIAGATGDLDGNGDVELIVTGTEGLRALRPYVPTDQATLWSLPFQARLVDVLVTELDGDALPEIVAATVSSGISRSGVLALDGETGTVRWSRRLAGGSRIIRAADFDGDGRADIISVGDGQTLSWLRGTDGSDLYPPQPFNGVPSDLELGDLNDDGIPEVVVALSDGKVMALNGASGSVLWTYQSNGGTDGGGDGIRAIALGDQTGDGIPDVVAVGEGTPASLLRGDGNCSSFTIGSRRGALILALNGANGNLRWDYGEPGFEIFRAVSLGDFNGDGVPDAVAHGGGIESGHLVALDGRGKVVEGVPTADAQSLWAFTTAGPADGFQFATSPDAIAIGDGSSDGTPDAYLALSDGRLLAISGAVPSERTELCAPQATKLWEVRRTYISQASFLPSANGPLVFLISDDTLVALLNAGTGNLISGYDGGGYPSLSLAHLSGDGRPEVGAGTRAGRIFALKGDGSSLTANDNFLPQGVIALTALDTNSDGAAELVGASPDGTVRAVNPATGAPVWGVDIQAEPTALAAGSGVIVVGTADGKLIGLNAANGSAVWQVTNNSRINAVTFGPGLFVAGDEAGNVQFINAAGATAQPPFASAAGSVHAITLVDVDGNGVKEFAVAVGNSFFVLRANGSFLWRSDVAKNAWDVAGVDLDGDGAQEIVGTDSDGLFTGFAYAFAGRTGASLWSFENGLPGGIAALDINGDGKQEALLAGAPNFFTLWSGTLRAVNFGGTILGTCILNKRPFTIAGADFDGNGAPEAIVATEEGDIFLVKGTSPPLLEPLKVVSRKIHGGDPLKTFDVPLPLTGSAGIECRRGGANGAHKLVFTFANPVTVSGTPDKARVTSGTGTVSNVTVNGAEVTVDLTGVTNAQKIILTLFNVSDGTNTGDVSVPISVLLGDTTGDGVVDSGDITQVRRQSGQVTAESNKRIDLTVDGVINSGDITLVRRQSGTALPNP